jgi:hypothetical protein
MHRLVRSMSPVWQMICRDEGFYFQNSKLERQSPQLTDNCISNGISWMEGFVENSRLTWGGMGAEIGCLRGKRSVLVVFSRVWGHSAEPLR